MLLLGVSASVEAPQDAERQGDETAAYPQQQSRYGIDGQSGKGRQTEKEQRNDDEELRKEQHPPPGRPPHGDIVPFVDGSRQLRFEAAVPESMAVEVDAAAYVNRDGNLAKIVVEPDIAVPAEVVDEGRSGKEERVAAPAAVEFDAAFGEKFVDE